MEKALSKLVPSELIRALACYVDNKITANKHIEPELRHNAKQELSYIISMIKNMVLADTTYLEGEARLIIEKYRLYNYKEELGAAIEIVNKLKSNLQIQHIFNRPNNKNDRYITKSYYQDTEESWSQYISKGQRGNFFLHSVDSK